MSKITNSEILLEVRRRATAKKRAKYEWIFDSIVIAITLIVTVIVLSFMTKKDTLLVWSIFASMLIPISGMLVVVIFRDRFPIKAVTPYEFNQEFAAYKKETEEKITTASEVITANQEILDVLNELEPHL